MVSVLLLVVIVLLIVWQARLARLEKDFARLRSQLEDLQWRVRESVASPERRRDVEQIPAFAADAATVDKPITPPSAPAPVAAPPPASAAGAATAGKPVAQPEILHTAPAYAASVFEPPLSEAPTETSSEAVERAIGERWLLYAGVIVLLLGVVFFLRYAFDRNWLSPVVRVALGGVAGAALVVGGRRLAAIGYRNYGLIIAGSGFVAIYLSVYAALNFYDLLSPAAAFALLSVTSAVAAWVADRDIAPALAVVAVCGGFVTPFLVGRGEDAQGILFSYDALLIAATTYLAFRRTWWYLNLVSFVFTTMTVMAWMISFYTPAKAVRTELFLTLYCTMFLIILRTGLRSDDRETRRASDVLIAAPIGYHVLSIAILFSHVEAFLTYVILATTASLLIAERGCVPVLRAVAWAGIGLPLGAWLAAYPSSPLPAAVAAIGAVYVAHLVAQVATLRSDQWRHSDTALVHANGLGLYGALYLFLEPRVAHLMAALAMALAVWNAGLAWWVSAQRAGLALHWAAVAGTLIAIAIAVQFAGPWVVVMWGVEGAAVIVLAMRARELWFRAAGWALLIIAVVRWLSPDVQQTIVSASAIVNTRAMSGLLLVALLYVLAFLQARQREDLEWSAPERAVMILGASALTIAVITTEIQSYWEVQALRGDDTSLAREAMLSTAWALYAAAAIAIGIRRQYAPIRYFAIALFGITVAKVFLVDLATLAGIYRIVAFFIVGIVLLFASFLYQRGRK